MKQHITVEQLNEYNKDCWTGQQIKKVFETKSLDEYLHQRESEWLMSNRMVNWDRWDQIAGDWEEKTSKVITIGKLIEVLHNSNNKCYISIDYILRSEWAGESDWHVNTYDKIFIKEELCDALWEAVKYVLEEEK